MRLRRSGRVPPDWTCFSISLIQGSTPQKYETWLSSLVEQAQNNTFFGEPVVCIDNQYLDDKRPEGLFLALPPFLPEEKAGGRPFFENIELRPGLLVRAGRQESHQGSDRDSSHWRCSVRPESTSPSTDQYCRLISRAFLAAMS